MSAIPENVHFAVVQWTRPISSPADTASQSLPDLTTVSGNLNLTFPGVDADRLVGAVQPPDIALSTNAEFP